MNEETSKNNQQSKTSRPHAPCVSKLLADGTLVELARNGAETFFVLGDTNGTRIEKSLQVDGLKLCPYKADNNILKHNVVLLPSDIEDYDDEKELIAEIEDYIDRYVDLKEQTVQLASHYVLLTWVYDRFNELPYLRLRGDFGSGKTRFLQVIGSICNRPIFASGGSTVSPLFHLLDTFAGTLILDEADFRFSDEKTDIVKILNSGNVKGTPILRTMATKAGEFDPRAFHVFGPKIIAGRKPYQDPALESRCITIECRTGKIDPNIPINLPDSQLDEARGLRNKLLCYRFRNFQSTKIDPSVHDRDLDNRINQVYAPLLSIASSRSARQAILDHRETSQQSLQDRRHFSLEAALLESIYDLKDQPSIKVKDIANRFRSKHGRDFGRHITNRYIGGAIRTKLMLRTAKSNGNYVIPTSERPKLNALFQTFGVSDQSDDNPLDIVPLEIGDFGEEGQKVIHF